MIKKTFYLFSFFVFLLFIQETNAGGPPKPPKGKPPCAKPPCPIPIDGGIGFLLAAGVAYGAKKIYGASKKNKE